MSLWRSGSRMVRSAVMPALAEAGYYVVAPDQRERRLVVVEAPHVLPVALDVARLVASRRCMPS